MKKIIKIFVLFLYVLTGCQNPPSTTKKTQLDILNAIEQTKFFMIKKHNWDIYKSIEKIRVLK